MESSFPAFTHWPTSRWAFPTSSSPAWSIPKPAVRSKQSAVLVWQTTGVVGQVNATRGQVVSTDAVLAELKQSSLPQSIILARANIVAAQKTLDNLLNTSVARANAELALMKAQKALDDATKAQRSKQFQVASPETIDIVHANLITANDALDKAEAIFNRNNNRGESDPVYAAALAMYAKARQNQIVAQYNYDYVKGLPNSLDVQTANASLDVAQANLTAAKQEWDRVKDGPNQQDVSAAQAQVLAVYFHAVDARVGGNVGASFTISPGLEHFAIFDQAALGYLG